MFEQGEGLRVVVRAPLPGLELEPGLERDSEWTDQQLLGSGPVSRFHY